MSDAPDKPVSSNPPDVWTPETRTARFRMGESRYDDVNRPDVGTRFSTLDNLAVNRAAEPEREFASPPTRRRPLLRNLVRMLPTTLLGGSTMGFAVSRLGGGHPEILVPIVALGACVVGAGVWYVLVIAPSRWDG